MSLKAIANKTIPPSDGKQVLTKKIGLTADIVTEVLAAFKDSRGQLSKFAPHLKAATLRQTLFNVWNFWKSNVKYQVDPKGKQLVKEPKALWALKVGDCKSLSVAVMSTIDSLGIKAAFRFTGYNGNTEYPTHVYVVVKDKGEEIPVDCVWKNFGKQKEPFSKNWDYNMPTEIYRVSGVEDNAIGKPFFNMQAMRDAAVRNSQKRSPFKLLADRRAAVKKHTQKRCVLVLPPGDISQEQMFILLKKQGFEIEQRNHIVSKGIGATGDTTDMAYEIQITGLHNAAAEFMKWPRKKLIGFKNPKQLHQRDHCVCKNNISGISDAIMVTDGNGESIAFDVNQANVAAEAIEGFFGSLWKGIKSVGKAIGKGAKAVGKGIVKVVSAPVKLIAKGVKAVGKFAGKLLTAPARNAIMNDLPGYAPFFLYTFITDPRILAKMPPIVKTKRDKALHYRNLFTGKLQISAANFDQAVRNGIMLKFQQTPEQVIAQWIKDTNFQIGFLGSILGAAAGLVGKGLKAIVGDTGESIATDAENYAPAVEDWGQLTQEARVRLGLEVAQTAPQPLTTQDLYSQVQSGQYANYALPAAAPYTPPYTAPSYDYNSGANTLPQSQPFDFSGGGSAGDDYGRTGGGDYPDAGSRLALPQQMDEVVLNRPATTSGGNTGIILAALAAVALIAASSKKKRA